jgi:hypothetical protein
MKRNVGPGFWVRLSMHSTEQHAADATCYCMCIRRHSPGVMLSSLRKARIKQA